MNNYQERLQSVIPGGAHTYSRGADQFPSNAPQILSRGKGPYVYGPSGEKLLDYGMALRAVTLGYSNDRVNAAAIRQIENGNNLTRASLIELEAAERFVEIIPSADMVKFAKNGSNVTSAAVKLSRAFNGKKYVCVPKEHPFFSFDDWFIGTTTIKRGIPESQYSTTLVFEYGNIESLKRLFEKHPGEISCVLMEPATSVTPCATDCHQELTSTPTCSNCNLNSTNFLHQVQALCREEEALFILDEMITGFRWNLKGASHYFGVEPDLVTFGKGMANGFSLAAVAGRRDVMELGSIHIENMERTFLLSSTHGGEMSSLGAFVETMNIYEECNVTDHMWEFGSQMKIGFDEITRAHSLEDYFSLEGPSIALNYVLRDQNKEISLPLRTLFAQEMVKNGVLIPWVAVSLSHGTNELELTLEAFDKSLSVVKKALSKSIDHYLEGPAVKPVWRKHN